MHNLEPISEQSQPRQPATHSVVLRTSRCSCSECGRPIQLDAKTADCDICPDCAEKYADAPLLTERDTGAWWI